jgi:ribonuclease-3
MEPLDQLQQQLGYRFRRIEWLIEALTHASCPSVKEGHSSYQRLEFLGDAILGLALAELLYHGFPAHSEGILASMRSRLASKHQLLMVAKRLQLGQYIRTGTKSSRTGIKNLPSVLTDVVEALIGAVYLDSRDYLTARAVITRLYGPQDIVELAQEALTLHNPKGRLQEWINAHGGNASSFRYEVHAVGPPHAPLFHIHLWLGSMCLGQGSATTKKAAEEQAATVALDYLRKHPDFTPADVSPPADGSQPADPQQTAS